MTRVLLATVLCGALLALGSAGAASAEAAGSEASLVPWVPSESWAGGRQYDPRLERTVGFWGAGMPLRDVFAGVKEQTGVEIGFWPAGDMNERICVTLYLNPEKPPTLRELMAQLSWVVDCGFSVSDGVEGERTYCLLSTSIGQGDIKQRLEEEMTALLDETGRERDRVRAEKRRRFPARLAEFGRALELTRDEVIAQYRGVDDLMMLALLDPRRRAVGQFGLGLSDEDMAGLMAGEQITREWSGWSAEQREWLKRSISATLPEWSAAVQEAQAEEGPNDWLDREQPEVQVMVTHVGLYVEVSGGEEGWRPDVPRLPLTIGGEVEAETGLPAYLQMEVRRALGETITLEQEREIVDEHHKRAELYWRGRRGEELLGKRAPRLGDAWEALESLRLPVGTDREYALWQIQEAVAVASGMDVVSDCFWQPERRLDFLLGPLYPDGAPELTALDVLRLSCLDYSGRLQMIYMSWRDLRYAEGWEWGQAGEFLQFRSMNRDMWRAAFLPADVVDAIHSWIEPYLVRDPETGRYPPVVGVALDLRECAEVAAQLGEANWRWGAGVIYGSLTDERRAYLRAFREEMLSFLLPEWRGVEMFRGLTDDQWKKLHEQGLVWRAELAPQPIRAERGGHARAEEGDVVRLVEIESAQIDWDHDPSPPVERVPIDRESWGGWHQLRVVVVGPRRREGMAPHDMVERGAVGNSLWDFPTRVKVQPKSTERLVGAKPSD